MPVQESDYRRIFACLDGVRHAGLAVSGGADSTALMHMARRWQVAAGPSAPCLSVLSVDHGLRDGSATEAESVAEQARTLGLDAAILRWSGQKGGSALQERARQARYGLMAGYAHANGLDALVTAHHLDDQAETFLMRLARGSGVDGLAGIPKSGQWAGLAVHRPLLGLSKARLVATLRQFGVDWLEDPSNDDARFERVRIRAAMEELESLGLGAEALARSASRLRRAQDALELTTDRFLASHASLNDLGFGQIRTDALHDVAEDIALRALAHVIQAVGGQPSAPNMARLESLVAAIRSGDEAVRTLGGCWVVPDSDDVLVLRETGRSALETLVLKPGESGLWDNRFHVSLDAGVRAPVEVRALGEEGYGTVRARLGAPVNLPARAADGVVSFWRDNAVLCVPAIGFYATSRQDCGCRARFVNHLGL